MTKAEIEAWRAALSRVTADAACDDHEAWLFLREWGFSLDEGFGLNLFGKVTG